MRRKIRLLLDAPRELELKSAFYALCREIHRTRVRTTTRKKLNTQIDKVWAAINKD